MKRIALKIIGTLLAGSLGLWWHASEWWHQRGKTKTREGDDMKKFGVAMMVLGFGIVAVAWGTTDLRFDDAKTIISGFKMKGIEKVQSADWLYNTELAFQRERTSVREAIEGFERDKAMQDSMRQVMAPLPPIAEKRTMTITIPVDGVPFGSMDPKVQALVRSLGKEWTQYYLSRNAMPRTIGAPAGYNFGPTWAQLPSNLRGDMNSYFLTQLSNQR